MRTCAFCPNTADSKEHIWSKWILNLLPETKDGVFKTRKPDGSPHHHKASKPDQRAKIVCTSCNNTWMSTKLELPMKALTSDIITKDTQKIFSPEDCRKITAWSFKTAVIADQIDPKKEPFFSNETRYAFARNLFIPAGIQVWISQLNVGRLTALYGANRRPEQPAGKLTPHLLSPPPSPYRFEVYSCTFSVGYLLLQIAAARWTEREVRQRLDFPAIGQPQILDDYATAVWPNDGFSIIWPPPKTVRSSMFAKLCNRFKDFSFPDWMGG